MSTRYVVDPAKVITHSDVVTLLEVLVGKVSEDAYNEASPEVRELLKPCPQ